MLTHVFMAAELHLDLEGDTNGKFGELTLSMASSLASTAEVVENANLAAGQLGPGLAVVENAIQATAPLVTEVTAQFDAWQPLLSRLRALVEVGDMLAEARFYLELSDPASTKRCLQTGSPLDQVSMGSCLSSV
jgi:hypothetical protein